MASIFYGGDLQSGIRLALKDSKFVACFIRDEGEESEKWEDEYLGDAQVRAALSDRAISLRIQDGSQEAGFLAAYYPVSAVPALIIIHNGSLAMELRSGQTKATFKARLLTALIPAVSPSFTPSITSDVALASTSSETPTTMALHQGQLPEGFAEVPTNSPQTSVFQQSAAVSSRSEPPTTPESPIQQDDVPRNSTSSSGDQQSVVQRLLEDRRRKFELDKRQKEAAEKADRRAKAEARRDSVTAAPDSAKAKRATYAQQQRKSNAEAKLERDRILSQIEQDKIDRREKEKRRRALAKPETQCETSENSNVPERWGNESRSMFEKRDTKIEGPKSNDCAVQVRLFDGSTIRSKFKTEQTLTDVREWVDKEKSDDLPYTFKQILSPLPNRSLTISEEKDSLVRLDFVPSATLIMVPIKGYTAAYTDNGQTIISKVASIPYNAVTAGVGLVSGALGTFLGFGETMPQEGESSRQVSMPASPEPQSGTADLGINIRTLRDQREVRDDYQLYNGNQINVEPQNDEREKEE